MCGVEMSYTVVEWDDENDFTPFDLVSHGVKRQCSTTRV